MNGIERILEGIESDTAAKKAAMQAAFDAEKKIAEDELASAVGEIRASYKKKTDEAVAALYSRGATQKERRIRDIKLAARSDLVGRAFTEAVRRFGDAEDYPETLSSLLIKALDDASRNVRVSDSYRIRMRERDLCHLEKMLSDAKKARADVPDITPGEFIDDAGFILTDGEVEINCTASALVAEKRTSLTPAAAAILFE